MGGFRGKYSRNPMSIFDEEKNDAIALMPEGVPVCDDDQNDGRLALFNRMRRHIQLFGEYGSPNNGFRVYQAVSAANNFAIRGGGVGNADIEAAGRFFIKGMSCVLLADVDYMSDLATFGKKSIHPRITNVTFDGTNTVIEDSAANWVADELIGRSVKTTGTAYAIIDNDQDTLTISGNHASEFLVGANYILTLTTPGAAREDAVYLNVYLDEIDSEDDPDILKTLGGQTVEAQLRARIIQALFVRQDVTTHGELTDYVDSDGNRHFVFKLAKLDRTTSSSITTAMITDYVTAIGWEPIDLDKLTMLKAAPTSPAGNTVYVSPGQALGNEYESIVQWAGGNSGTFGPVTTNPRWDALCMTPAGTLRIFQGAEAVSPTKPPFIGTPIAFVYVDETTTVVVDDADIVDARAVFSPNRGDVKILHPGHGTILEQIAMLGGLTAGDRYMLLPGSYTLGGNLSISQPNVIIFGSGISAAGSGGAVIDIGSYSIAGGAYEFTIKNVTLTTSTADLAAGSCMISVGYGNCVIDGVSFSSSGGSSVRRYAIRVDMNGNILSIKNCLFDVYLGGTSAAAYIILGLDSGSPNIVLIENNTAYVGHASNLFFYSGSPVGGHGKILNNNIYINGALSGIVFSGAAQYWTISGNVISGSGDSASFGISASGDRTSICNNRVYNVQYGIASSGDYCSVVANIVFAIASGGIPMAVSGVNSAQSGNICRTGSSTIVSEDVSPNQHRVGSYLAPVSSYSPALQVGSGPVSNSIASFGRTYSGANDSNKTVLHQRVSTSDATKTALWSWTLPVLDRTWLVTAHVIARRTGGTAGAAGDSAGYVRVACVNDEGGVAALVGAVGSLFTVEDQAGWDCTLEIIGGTTLQLSVTGAALNSIDWLGEIEILERV